MGLAFAGLTHCIHCGKSLGEGEYVTCKYCKEILEKKEKEATEKQKEKEKQEKLEKLIEKLIEKTLAEQNNQIEFINIVENGKRKRYKGYWKDKDFIVI